MMSGDGISVLVPQTSFHGETVGGFAKCWLFFFFPDKLSMAAGLEKNLKFILSIGQTALKFSSPTVIAYFVKHYLCVCGYLDPCPLCGQVRFRSYFFRSKFTFMKWMKLFSSCAPVFNKPSSPMNIVVLYRTKSTIKKIIGRFLHTVRNLSFLCKYNAPNADIHMISHLKISNCILLIFKPSFWQNKIVC